LEFITDRTQYHVNYLKKLQSIGWDNMTDSQRTDYQGYAAKGAYNYTDLNRVESAVAELAGMLGLSLSTKTNWWTWDFPTKSEMNRYLTNVAAVRDACPGDPDFPPLPSSMDYLTYETANNIEKVLEIVYSTICGRRSGVIGTGILGEMVLGKDLK
jgi:hypothetical protein